MFVHLQKKTNHHACFLLAQFVEKNHHFRRPFRSKKPKADTEQKRSEHLSYVNEVTEAIHQAEAEGFVATEAAGWLLLKGFNLKSRGWKIHILFWNCLLIRGVFLGVGRVALKSYGSNGFQHSLVSKPFNIVWFPVQLPNSTGVGFLTSRGLCSMIIIRSWNLGVPIELTIKLQAGGVMKK